MRKRPTGETTARLRQPELPTASGPRELQLAPRPRHRPAISRWLSALLLGLFLVPALAAQHAPAFNLGAIPGLSQHGSDASWNILVLLTLLTLIPALLVSLTPFIRLLLVFHFLRQALGTMSAPSNQILIGLSLFLTYFIMAPVGTAMYNQAVVPYSAGKLTMAQALDRASGPLETFMLHTTREKDLALFVGMAHVPQPRTPADLPMRVVIPAYMISELQTGFQIGVVLFLPFMVIDMVVASVTTSMGMMQLPPVVISTPLKLMIFVAAGGWHLLVGSLVRSFF